MSLAAAVLRAVTITATLGGAPRPDVALDAVLATETADDAAMIVAWSFAESAWRTDVCSADAWSCGSMQIAPRVWGSVPSSRRAQFEQSAAVLRILEAACGTRRRAWQAYASGKCDGAPRKVQRRAELAGVDLDQPRAQSAE